MNGCFGPPHQEHTKANVFHEVQRAFEWKNEVSILNTVFHLTSSRRCKQACGIQLNKPGTNRDKAIKGKEQSTSKPNRTSKSTE